MNKQASEEKVFVPKELGKAGIIIELEDGIITIFHSEAPEHILKQWKSSGNDWDTMWELFEELAEKGNDES